VEPKLKEIININVRHALLSHPVEEKLRATAKMLKWNLRGILQLCAACVQANARAKKISKTTLIKATKPGERLGNSDYRSVTKHMPEYSMQRVQITFQRESGTV
jgi:hypothetical protein